MRLLLFSDLESTQKTLPLSLQESPKYFDTVSYLTLAKHVRQSHYSLYNSAQNQEQNENRKNYLVLYYTGYILMALWIPFLLITSYLSVF